MRRHILSTSSTTTTQVNTINTERNRLSILLKDIDNNCARLLVRGTDQSMKNLINFEESDHYKWAVDYNETHGLKSVVYGSKIISLDEAEEFCREYQAASKTTIDREGRFSSVAKAMETNLKLEGIVGFTCALRQDALPTFKQLRDMGVNVHILSGDNFEHNMMAVHQLKMIGNENKQIVLNFSDEESGKAQLKKALEAINQNMDGKNGNLKEDIDPVTPRFKKSQTMKSSSKLKPKNLILVISGQSVDIIRNSTYLYEHTLFIFEFSKSVIGFDMSGNQKATVVKMFQKLQKTVMAVGDGFNDVNMVQAANVGIQMLDSGMGFQFGDILVDNLICIAKAMKRDCRNWNNNLHMSVHYFFVYSNTLIFVSLFYQIYCAASGSTLLNSYFICMTQFFMIPIGVSYVFLNEVYVEKTRDMRPGLYCEKNYLTRRVNLRLMLIHMMPQSLIEGAVVLILPIHSLYYQVRPDGTLEYLPTLTIVVFTLVLLSFTFNMVIVSEHNRVLLGLIYAGIWGLMILTIYFVLAINLLENLYTIAIPSFFGSPNSVVLLIAIALWIMCWNKFYWVAFGHRKYYPIYNMIRRAIEADDQIIIRNTLRSTSEQFLDQFKMTDPFTTTYRKSFKYNSSISTIISSLLVIKKEQLKESSNWWLDFKSISLAKNYSIYIDFRFSWILKIVGITSTVCLFIWLLLSYLIDPLVPYSSAWVYVFIMLLIPALYFCTFIGQWSAMAHSYAIIFQYLLMVASILYTICVESTYSMLGTLIMVFLSLHFTVSFKNYLLLVVFSLAGFALNFAANIKNIRTEQWGVNDGNDLIYPLLSLSFLFVAIAVATILQRHKSEILIKEEFTTNANLDNNSAMAKDLLGMLLPKFILDRRDNYHEVTALAECIEDQARDGVTILFCDIADFDEVVRKNENNIVFMLDKIFRKFDELCVMHGIQKIETVGKTYMACSGLKDVEECLSQEVSSNNQTLRMIDFAKDMMEHIKEYEGLALKIGIHFGKPVMGVIGYHKPQFSLIGDAVNTTSRHCTTGKKGRIMLSKEVWDIVGHLNNEIGGYLVDTVKVEMKGKGLVPVYQLFQRNNALMIILNRVVAHPPPGIVDPEMHHLIDLLRRYKAKVKSIQFKNMMGERFFKVVTEFRNRSLNTYKNFKMTQASKNGKIAEIDDRNHQARYEDNHYGTYGTLEALETEGDQLKSETIDRIKLDSKDDTEKLNPSINLEFKNYQYDLITKYSENLKDHNSQNLRVFFILMSLEYILQIILHATFRQELLEVKLAKSIRYSSFVKSANIGGHRFILLLFSVLPDYLHQTQVFLHEER